MWIIVNQDLLAGKLFHIPLILLILIPWVFTFSAVYPTIFKEVSFDNKTDLQICFNRFCNSDFFKLAVEKPLQHWKKVIDNTGKYITDLFLSSIRVN